MGIRHRSLDGVHPNTPWMYLGPAHLYEALSKKTADMNTLKLTLVSTKRTLDIRNRTIDGWKRLSIIIGRDNIPRLRTLIAVQLRRGASVFSILEKVEAAARRAYSPRGYDAAEFELGFLLYKIGGRAIAMIAHRALGMPSIDSTKRHISTVPLKASATFPTSEEIHANLSACYPSDDESTTATSGIIEGMQITVDELKISERLRWDPISNNILGVCREHGHRECSLVFQSHSQADALLDCLKEKTVHLASEVCYYMCI